MIDPNIVTKQTYNTIADEYFRRTQDRASLENYLSNFVDSLEHSGAVLDLGCGPGFDTHWFNHRNITAIGMDIAHNMLRLGMSRFSGDFILADMRQMPFPRESFVGMWANASVQHIQRSQSRAVLKECWRVLKPSGILFISVKAGERGIWENARYGADLPRWFTLWKSGEFDQLIHNTGYEIVSSEDKELGDETWLMRYCCKT